MEDNNKNDELFGFAPEQPNTPTDFDDSQLKQGELKTVKKNDLPKRILIILMCVFTVVITFLLGFLTSGWAESAEMKTYKWAMEQIEKYYIGDVVEGVGPFTKDDYMKYGFSLLDKYSAFLTPAEAEKEIMESQGSGSGVGISYKIADVDGVQYAQVSRTVKGAPAYGKLYEGDLMIKINDKNVEITASGVRFPLNGFGSEKFTILRPEYQDAQQKIEYRQYDVAVENAESYTASYVTYVDNQMANAPAGLLQDSAYVKFDMFNMPASAEFDAVFSEMQREGRTNLILDLRGNPGGALDITAHIASYLIGDGSNKTVPLFKTEFKSGSPEITKTTMAGKYESMKFDKIVVLIDENSASASEVLLAAMLDYNTCDLVIGSGNSYGKGIGQMIAYNQYGYGLRLTAMRWYSPKNVNIHGVGIAPTEGYVMAKDTVNYPYQYEKDSQIQKAIDFINAA